MLIKKKNFTKMEISNNDVNKKKEFHKNGN